MFSVHINSLKTTTLGISGVGFYKPDALPSSVVKPTVSKHWRN